MALDVEHRQTRRGARHAFGVPRFDWSAERIALLKSRWAQGRSASTIAKELGPSVTRCAVLGKIHRLRLTQPEFKRRHPRKDRAILKRRLRPPARPRTRIRAPSRLMAAFRALGLDAFLGSPDTGSVHSHAGKAFGAPCTLLDLSEQTCRWPVGDPGEADFAFCGAAPFRRYPYCVAHCLIAYRPDGSESEPRTAAPGRPDSGMERAA